MLSKENERLKARKLTQKQQRAVFDVAKKYGGEVTLSNIYSNTNLSYNELDKFLAILNTKDYVKSQIDEETGVVKYIFPEIINSTEDRKFYEKLALDKLYIKLKYGGSGKKPIEDLERCILLIAEHYQGKLSIYQIVEIVSLDIEEIESVLISLCSKGLCVRDFGKAISSEQVEYVFPEIVEMSKNKNIKKNFNLNVNLNLNINDIPLKILDKFVDKFVNNFTEEADKFIIRNKVTKYRAKASISKFLDSVLPGFGHLDGRFTFIEYLIYFVLPFTLTAGISYIPSMVLARYNTFKYYSISEEIFNKNVSEVNRNSLIYALVLSVLYAKIIGLHGFIFYYSYILNFFN